MRTKHELIQNLMDSLNRVSYRNRDELDAFKHQAETMIKTLQGDTSEYRYQLQEARFAPWAFEASEEDYQKSWGEGKESILNILKALDVDEKLNLQDASAAKKIEPIELTKPVEEVAVVKELTKPTAEVTPQGLPASAPPAPPQVFIETSVISTQDNVPPEQQEPPKKIESPPVPAASTSPKQPQLSNRIFLIHGSNEGMKEKVSAVLKKWGLTAVLSFDRENFHNPLAQKMTEFSDVAFVIVLLSFDGYFYGKDQKVKDAKLISQPNVIFELGFMLGKFGRDKVFVLYDEKKNYELPTDFFNAYYIPYNENRFWQDDLAKALKNLGTIVNRDERRL